MTSANLQLWDRFRTFYSDFPTLGLSLDLSRMNFPDGYFDSMKPRLDEAFAAMKALEAGAIANPDEKRKVGHYWLRNPALAPDPAIRKEIENTQRDILDFVQQVRSGSVGKIRLSVYDVLVIGIGGSALGPQFVSAALGHPRTDPVRIHFFDNTDPDGMDRALAALEGHLNETLCVVISKSGGTKETRNGMIEARAAYEAAKVDFPSHAVAITGQGSALDQLAEREGWLHRFPMWDWVGGRTSETSAVGLVPAALQGIDIVALLTGARACDDVTRLADLKRNPAAQLALMWYHAGQGKGLKDMVIIPYKDRLELFSRYLQQLVMESLGKERDLKGNVVHQGIAVYGNKGSTDQHAYIQQLRDGINNFFVTFIRVLKDRDGAPRTVEPNITSGDYLDGFLLGTRKALFENGRESLTITVREVSPFSVGVLIALYERAVGFYASLIGINAYHQPGVEAGKKAAEQILKIERSIQEFFAKGNRNSVSISEVANGIGLADDPETVFHILEHLAANPGRGIVKQVGATPLEAHYGAA